MDMRYLLTAFIELVVCKATVSGTITYEDLVRSAGSDC